MSVELLPCPFCGGTAEHHDIGNEHTKSRGTKVWCTGCFFAKTVKAIRHDLDWTRAQAIAAWNTRPTPPSLQSVMGEDKLDVDDLAQEIRRVSGSHRLGAGALSEALMPFLITRLQSSEAQTRAAQDELAKVMDVIEPHWRGAGVLPSAEFILLAYCGLSERYEDLDEAHDTLKAQTQALRDALEPFQDRVAKAHVALFHDDPTDLAERRDRFTEEALEVAQATGMTADEAHQLVNYTFSRPVGEPEKEIGAAALTLASLCVVGGWDLMVCAEADLAQLKTPEKIAKVRAKRATRHGRGSLPGTLSSQKGEGV